MFGEISPKLKGILTDTTLLLMAGRRKLGLNLASANTWTAPITVLRTGLGTTITGGQTLINTTTSTPTIFQNSPATRWIGQGYNNLSGSSTPIEFTAYTAPGVGFPPKGAWHLGFSADAGATYTDVMTVSSKGVITGASAVLNNSNGSSSFGIGIDHLSLNNTGGSFDNIGFYWGGTFAAGIQGYQAGGINFYATASAGFNFYVSGSSITTQIYYDGVYSNKGIFNSKVTAGTTNTTPPGTLNNYGNAAKTWKLVTGNYLANQEERLLCDTTNAFACTGTPTYQCAHWTNSTDCNANSNHGGHCSWFGGSDCSVFNGDVGTCGGTTGCSPTQNSCAGPTDSTSCTNQNSAYGGSCAFNNHPITCSGLDEGTCGVLSGIGCTQNYTACTANYAACTVNYAPCAPQYFDCTPFSDGGGDGTACYAANPACSYDSGSGACTGNLFIACNGSGCSGYSEGVCASQPSGDFASCSGGGTCSSIGDAGTCAGTSYFTNCSGGGTCTSQGDETSCLATNYFTSCTGSYDNYTCDGTYYTGVCTGTYGANCSGTVACSYFTSSTPCSDESGCTGGSGILLTLPDINTIVASKGSDSGMSLEYGAKKRNTGAGSVTIQPTGAGDTIEGQSNISFSTKGDGGIWIAVRELGSCNADFGDEGSCAAKTGCYWTAQDCSQFGDEGSCTPSGCSWDSGSMTCGGTFGAQCNGIYTKSTDWVKTASLSAT